MPTVDTAAASASSCPRAPDITVKDLVRQFWLDVKGKEVQSASTYSYTWLADQAGHIGLGMLIYALLALVVLPTLGVPAWWNEIWALVVGTVSVSYWEYRAYNNAVASAIGLFPVDRKLLRSNAVIAAAYMTMGVVTGLVFQQTALWRVVGLLTVAILAVVCALPWLRQKIVWQKAALPYLFRLADAPRTMNAEDAQELQAIIDKETPPKALPYQVIVGGPIGSGRTKIAAGIGTEFAFKKRTVRYVSLDTLLEFAARPPSPDFADDTGPVNINYWRWSEAQVVIIDDIGPLIALLQEANPEHFQELLRKRLAAASQVLAKCHTVWVIGDMRPDGQTAMVGDELDKFARVIGLFCKGKNEALVVELAELPRPTNGGGARPMPEAEAHPVKIRKVKW